MSAILTEAVRVPVARGVKVTLMVQLAAAATLVPQVLDWAKSPEFAPVRLTLVMLSVALPPFVRVIVWAAVGVPTARLVNARLVGASVTAGAGAVVPVPVKETV